MSADEVVGAVTASSVSELCWVDATGQPQVRGVVALGRDGRPALAFTYADEPVARSVAAAPTVVLSVAEKRSTGRDFRPLLLTGRPRLVEDPTGDVFVSDLLTQELHRFPPSRLLADSPLLMREHWWYLPRLVVELEVDAVEPLPARAAPHDHLLVVADSRQPVVRVAAPRELTGGRLEVDLAGKAPLAGDAVLFGQDASFPDLEQWSQWHYRGRWDGAAFAVVDAPVRVGLGPAPGLLQRWKRQRTLERRCVAAIPRP